jgi:cellulose synthase/poly-beta-1,6-N-acetylglucosamine synthase-like glycosyltransferase
VCGEHLKTNKSYVNIIEEHSAKIRQKEQHIKHLEKRSDQMLLFESLFLTHLKTPPNVHAIAFFSLIGLILSIIAFFMSFMIGKLEFYLISLGGMLIFFSIYYFFYNENYKLLKIQQNKRKKERRIKMYLND